MLITYSKYCVHYSYTLKAAHQLRKLIEAYRITGMLHTFLFTLHGANIHQSVAPHISKISYVKITKSRARKLFSLVQEAYLKGVPLFRRVKVLLRPAGSYTKYLKVNLRGFIQCSTPCRVGSCSPSKNKITSGSTKTKC